MPKMYHCAGAAKTGHCELKDGMAYVRKIVPIMFKRKMIVFSSISGNQNRYAVRVGYRWDLKKSGRSWLVLINSDFYVLNIWVKW